jgi:uncharacterized protein YecT (DUF1311 family)
MRLWSSQRKGDAHVTVLARALAAAVLSVFAQPALAAEPADIISDCLGPYGQAAQTEDPRRCVGSVAAPCLNAPEGETTLGMTQCIGMETKAWDAVLNRDYRALMGRLDEAQQEKLKTAQRAWIALRDADCDFPREFVRGSLSSVMAAECFQTHTADRVLALRRYIDFLEW